MALSEIKSSDILTPNSLIGPNYLSTLNQSIQNLLPQIHEENSNFANFLDVFSQLMQAKLDPPLESIWVYSALSFRGKNRENEDSLDRIAVAKDMFKLISAFSGSCNSLKSIALLAPVVPEVFKLVSEFHGKTLESKKDKKAMREIKSLIETILGYISICMSSADDSSDNCLGLIMPIRDLVNVWVQGDGALESFFPLVNSQIHSKTTEEDCNVSYLAGVVIVEFFLLKLCLDFQRDNVVELEKELRHWVVASITGFQNFTFFEIIVSMLLEPNLPVTSLLNSKDEVSLRKVLYESVTLDYSFLNPERGINIPAERIRNLALTRVMVTHEAVEFSREEGDQKRAILYSSAFSRSQLPSQIVKCIPFGAKDGVSHSNGASPKAFLKWLLDLELKGIKVFEDYALRRRALLATDSSAIVRGEKESEDVLFYLDNKMEDEDEDGEDEVDEEDDERMNELMSEKFVTAARTMKSSDNEEKKRKKRQHSGKMKKIKYVKYDLSQESDSARGKASSVSNGGSNSESEVEDPHSDNDSESE